MKINTLTLEAATVPDSLTRIASPPRRLFHRGAPLEELLKRPSVAVVGTRNVSPYGRRVTQELARELAGQGIVIISGLALGVDALAHQAALEANGLTIAVLPGPVDKVYPATNAGLAEQIVGQGGALLSEYDKTESQAFKAHFIARNRLIAGLAQVLLITEAAEKSGSLHTARFALEQGKDVLAVPGNITSPGSAGTNNLIKSGATPVTSYLDVLHILGLEAHQTAAREVRGRNAYEQRVLDLLLRGVSDGQGLLRQSQLTVSEFNQVLTMLEIGGKIRPLGSNHWAIF
jgi:DNA processing protein